MTRVPLAGGRGAVPRPIAQGLVLQVYPCQLSTSRYPGRVTQAIWAAKGDLDPTL